MKKALTPEWGKTVTALLRTKASLNGESIYRQQFITMRTTLNICLCRPLIIRLSSSIPLELLNVLVNIVNDWLIRTICASEKHEILKSAVSANYDVCGHSCFRTIHIKCKCFAYIAYEVLFNVKRWEIYFFDHVQDDVDYSA